MILTSNNLFDSWDRWSVLCFSTTGCGTLPTSKEQTNILEEPGVTRNSNQEDYVVEGGRKPEVGRFRLSADTQKFIFGKWKVKRLLGFYNAWNDASEYPSTVTFFCVNNERLILSLEAAIFELKVMQ